MKSHSIPAGFGTDHSHKYNWAFCLQVNTDYFFIETCYLGMSGKIQILSMLLFENIGNYR